MPVRCYLADPRLAESAPLQDCQSMANGPMRFLTSAGWWIPRSPAKIAKTHELDAKQDPPYDLPIPS